MLSVNHMDIFNMFGKEMSMEKYDINDGWMLVPAPFKTKLAKYGFMLSKGSQHSIIEARNNKTFKYILNYDTAAVMSDEGAFISPRGKGGKIETLEGALLAIGIKKENMYSTIKAIVDADFIKRQLK